MPDKSFEITLPFRSLTGTDRWLPIIPVTIFASDGSRHKFPLLFDTGAEVTYLRRELYYLFGVHSWDSGQRVTIGSVGSAQDREGYLYQSVPMQVFGRTIDSRVVLTELPENPLFLGLFGRVLAYEHFGFGFWEGTRELFATENP
jgi:hypothetical protein